MNSFFSPSQHRRNLSHWRRDSQSRAFSTLEVLIAVGVLAVVAAVGVMAMSGVTKGSKVAKLESDIATLNGAVKTYVASGGNFSGATTVNEVLAKMKTVVTAAQAKTQINPLTGSVIDRRLVAEMQTVAEAATSEPRVYWNPAEQSFTLANSGGVGVKRFVLDESLSGVAIQTEGRDGGSMAFNSSNGWVWNNSGQWTTDSTLTPSGVNTTPFPSPPPPASATAGTATAGTATAGTATAGSATAGTSTAGTSTGGTATAGDDGTPPDPPRLPWPQVTPPDGAYVSTDYPLSVTVANASTYGANGILKYQIDSGAWTPYVSVIAVQPDQTLRVQAFTTDATAYRDSYQNSGYYYAVASSFAGATDGKWKDVGGGPNLVYTITEAETFLSHGTPEIDLGDGTIVTAGEANTMKFLNANFSGVLPGQEFLLGEILYHNGTTFDTSHADAVRLQLDLAFTSPVVTERINIMLDLINTENTSDPDASADYVKFRNVNQVIQIDVGGATYDLDLQFGTTDANGFASSDQFHVYEGATARGELRGTMTLAP